MLQDTGSSVAVERRQDITGYIGWLQGARDSFVSSTVMKNQKAFRMSFMVVALVAAGFLKNTSSLNDALRVAVHACVKEPNLRDLLLSELDREARAIPSSSTVLRHKLSLHMGHCRWVSELTEAMVSDASGAVR